MTNFALMTDRGLIGLAFHTGPRDRTEIQTLYLGTSSCHQWQKLDDFNVVFITADKAYALDYAGLESVIIYLAEYDLESHLRQYLIRLQGAIKIKPKPEPEVAAAKPLPTEMLAPAAPVEDRKRWSARVRTKMWSGYLDEKEYLIEEVSELQDIIEKGASFPDIRNIKIKLEYRL
jgi:hypothetical protein